MTLPEPRNPPKHNYHYNLDEYNDKIIEKLRQYSKKLVRLVIVEEYGEAMKVLKEIKRLLSSIDDPYLLETKDFQQIMQDVKALEKSIRIVRILDVIPWITLAGFLAIVVALALS